MIAFVLLGGGALSLLWLAYSRVRREVGGRKQAEARLHAILDYTPTVVFMKDLQGRYLLANRRFEELFHVRQEKLLGKTDFDLFPGDVAAAFHAHDKKVLEIDAPVEVEELVPHDDGMHTYLSIKSPIHDESGKTYAICGLARDITDRKRAEQERDRFFTMSLDLQCVAGFDGAFKRLNPAWERTLGISLADMQSRPFIEFVHPEDRERTLREFSKVLTEGSTVSFENRYVCADGSYRWLLWSSVADSESRLIYATARDVTARKAMFEEAQRARDTAEAANKELEAFSYSVSHDLRAPLRSIDGFSQALLEDCAGMLDKPGMEHLHRIRDAAQRMGQLIDDLLMLSRIARAEVRGDRVDLSGLAREVAQEVRGREPNQEISLVIEDGLNAKGDRRLLRILLDNLLGNAFKFTRQRPQARIEVGSLPHDGGRVFFVRDNGAGFDMKYAQKLFSPFQRLHSAKEFEGTGIGLATVARIVQRLGGRVWAEGEVDGGASVYFTLQVPEEVPSHGQSTHPPGGGQPGRRGAHAEVLQELQARQ